MLRIFFFGFFIIVIFLRRSFLSTVSIQSSVPEIFVPGLRIIRTRNHQKPPVNDVIYKCKSSEDRLQPIRASYQLPLHSRKTLHCLGMEVVLFPVNCHNKPFPVLPQFRTPKFKHLSQSTHWNHKTSFCRSLRTRILLPHRTVISSSHNLVVAIVFLQIIIVLYICFFGPFVESSP